MDKDNKETSNKKKRIYRYIFITLICLIVISLLCILIVYILLNDNNKNKHVDNQNENSEIIKKEFIDGFKNTSLNGSFSFCLSNDDINQMLMNGYKAIGDNSIESIYYEEINDRQYFYIDLPTHFVPTRVVIETYIAKVENYSFELKINKVSKGKINVLDKLISKGYLTKEYVSKLADASVLPISYDDKNQSFKIDILNIMNYFPKGDMKDIIFDVVKNDITKYFSYGASIFSFNIDFSKLRSEEFKSSNPVVDPLDIKNSLVNKASGFNISEVPVGGEAELYSFSDSDFSNIMSNELNSITKEIYESNLTTNKASFVISYVHTLFLDNSIKYMINVSISGYEIDISINSDVTGSYPQYRMYLNLSIETKIKDIRLSESNIFKTNLYKLFGILANKYDYFTFSNESKIYGFDFSNISSLVYRPEMIYKTMLLSISKMSFIIQRNF